MASGRTLRWRATMVPLPPPNIPEQFDRGLALIDYNDAMAMEPELEISYLNRSGVYVSLGREDEALADIEHHLQLRPESPLGFLSRGRLLQGQKKAREAMADFERA